MRRKAADWVICLTAALISTSALAADRYEFIFTDANYSTPEQSELDYTSFIGDRQSGAIYSCNGKISLDQKTGVVARHTESCIDTVPPTGLPPREYSFSTISALDATPKPDKPKMNPAWGFWRIDQAKGTYAFCGRFLSVRSNPPAVIWTCFETRLPQS